MGGAINQGYAYLAAHTLGVQVIRLGAGQVPSPIFSTSAGAGGFDLRVDGDRLTLITESSLRVLDVANPAAPALLGSLPLTHGWCLAVLGNFAYLIDDTYFKVVDLADPSAPAVVAAMVEAS